MRLVVEHGQAQAPAAGFTACGDAICALTSPSVGLYAVVDALGHGPDAAACAAVAVAALRASFELPLAQLFAHCDRALRGPRGAVISAIRVDEDGVWFAGVGNVDVYGPRGIGKPAARPGIVGRCARPPREQPIQAAPGQRWVLVSDGIRRREVSGALDDVGSLEPQAAAESILARARREDDDASVLVIDFAEDRG